MGLDSSELGHPPSKFQRVFGNAGAWACAWSPTPARRGPPSYIREALDLLEAERIDHGVRAMEDPDLVARLVRERVPLTVCPFSNIKLRVFEDLAGHNLKAMLDRGLCVTVNSDDPAYFGGYLGQNYLETALALGLTRGDLATLARNSLVASFVPDAQRAPWLAQLESAAEAP